MFKDEALEGVMTVAAALSELCAALNKYAGQLELLATNECLGDALAIPGGRSGSPAQRVKTAPIAMTGRKRVGLETLVCTERGRIRATKLRNAVRPFHARSSPVANQGFRMLAKNSISNNPSCLPPVRCV